MNRKVAFVYSQIVVSLRPARPQITQRSMQLDSLFQDRAVTHSPPISSIVGGCDPRSNWELYVDTADGRDL
jgi:hypothetical protein